MHVFGNFQEVMMAKFHKEIPFLHKNDLVNGMVQVSEWNFDLTSVNLRVA